TLFPYTTLFRAWAACPSSHRCPRSPASRRCPRCSSPRRRRPRSRCAESCTPPRPPRGPATARASSENLPLLRRPPVPGDDHHRDQADGVAVVVLDVAPGQVVPDAVQPRLVGGVDDGGHAE